MKAKDALHMAGVALDGITMLDGLLHLGKPVEATLAAAKAAVAALREGIDGKTSPELVLAQIEALRERLAANDAAADTDLDRKFRS